MGITKGSWSFLGIEEREGWETNLTGRELVMKYHLGTSL